MSPFREAPVYEKSRSMKDSTLPRCPRDYRGYAGKERSIRILEGHGTSVSRGSLTVEAAIACSLFFLCMYMFWALFPVMQLQIKVQNAMEETGGRIAVSAPLLQMAGAGAEDEGVDDLPERIAKDAVFAVYAKSRIIKQTGEDVWKAAHIKGGANGLSMAGSVFSADGDVLLKASYRAALPGLPGKLISVRICQAARRKCWTGKSGNGIAAGEAEGDICVYVADTGSVYHKDPGCYHLNVTVKRVSAGAVGASRNNDGGKYRPCEHCAASASVGAYVFITPEGDRYHVTRDCSGLKRSLRMVPLSECGLPPCSNCGN